MEEIPVWEIFIQFSLTWPLVIFAPISIFLLRLFLPPVGRQSVFAFLTSQIGPGLARHGHPVGLTQ